MDLNPSLILNAGRDTMQLNDLSQIYANQEEERKRRELIRQQAQAAQDRTVMNAGYQAAMTPEGKVDHGILLKHLASNNMGSAIPGVLKTQREDQKAEADINQSNSVTGKNVQETLYKGLSQVDNTIAALVAKPDVTEKDVYGEMGRLVRAGAFDVQAEHTKKKPDEYALDLLSTMPVGNPQGLKNWLVQAGMRAADATERLKLSLPKYDLQDRGGTKNEGTIDQLTGVRTAGTAPGQTIAISPDANSVLSAETQRRGQNMVDGRMRETNDINRTALASQLVETPQGWATVNKDTSLARPIATMSGQPVLGKDSTAAQNANMARNMGTAIPMARELLQNATGSGVGALVDKMYDKFGWSSESKSAAGALQTLSGWMTSNVPRFEGPQSNKDTETYEIMAARVGDRSIAIEDRLKALATLEQLMAGHMNRPGTAPATTVAPPAPYGSGPTLARPGGGPPRAAPPAAAAMPAFDSFFINR